MLTQYPSLCTKTFLAFDCVPFEESALLRADPTIMCSGGEYANLIFVAIVGILVFAVGVPLAALLLTIKFGHKSAARRQLVRSLTKHYRSEVFFFESIDLCRKFLLTGVVTIVAPTTKIQLWFGAVLCQIFLALHVRIKPFKRAVDNLVQHAVHLQLVMNYVSALLFHSNSLQSPEDTSYMLRLDRFRWHAQHVHSLGP